MLRSTICLLLIACHLGCASKRAYQLAPITRTGKELPVSVVEVAANGKYLLRTSPSDPNVKNNPVMVERELKAGDSLGFEVTEKGELQAVAGVERIPLDGHYLYEWCLEVPEAELTKGQKVKNVLVVVGLGVGAVAVGLIVVAVGIISLAYGGR